ncbi:hypothetical protein J6590_078147 [Homalodisca vitripennis]|nr:hypothetical protein J6590_078147 [Homalodisca vitripennis]
MEWLVLAALLSLTYANYTEEEGATFMVLVSNRSQHLQSILVHKLWDYDTSLTDEAAQELSTAQENYTKYQEDIYPEVVKYPWRTFKDPLLRRQFKFLSQPDEAALTTEKRTRHTRKNNILITGVPVTPREVCLAILDSMGRALDIPFLFPEISIAHRLSSREGDTRPPVIVVSFVSRAVKAVWLETRRRSKTPARHLHSSFPHHQVYMNSHLTSHTRAIFNGARDLMKTGKLS